MSAYASLFNIDLDLPKKLVSFLAYSSPEEQEEFQREATTYINNKDTHNFIKKIFERVDYVLETNSEEGLHSCLSILLQL